MVLCHWHMSYCVVILSDSEEATRTEEESKDPENVSSAMQSQGVLARISILSFHLVAGFIMNFSNTSFDSNLPLGVKLRFSPDCRNSPSITNSRIAGPYLSAMEPNSSRKRPMSTPRFNRNPKKKLSSSACSALTAEALKSGEIKNLS